MTLKCDVAYVVQSVDGSIVKVGVSGNPRRRVDQITHSMPYPMRLVALVDGGKSAEREMKEFLAPWKLRGEWFDPRPELNEYLREKHKQNALLKSVPIDQEFCDNFIRPAVLDYLMGRQPTMTEPGDLVYRFLREGLSVVSGRMGSLHAAVKREISAELLSGFVPLSREDPTPALQLVPQPLSAGEAA